MNEEKILKKIIDKQRLAYTKHNVEDTGISSTYVKIKKDDSNLIIVPESFLARLKGAFIFKNAKHAKRAEWVLDEAAGTITLKIGRPGLENKSDAETVVEPIISDDDNHVSETRAIVDDEDDCDDTDVSCDTEDALSDDQDDTDTTDSTVPYNFDFDVINEALPVQPNERVIERLNTSISNSINKLRRNVCYSNNNSIAHNLNIYIKSLLIINKYRLYAKRTKSATYDFVIDNYTYAMYIRDMYERILVHSYINAVLNAGSAIMYDTDKQLNQEAYDFVTKITVDDLDLNKMAEVGRDMIYTYSANKYMSVLTDFIILKFVESEEIANELKPMMELLYRYSFTNDITTNDVLLMYDTYVSKYVEGKLHIEDDPVGNELLLCVFLMKYSELLDASYDLKTLSTFNSKYKTISKIINREFNTHVYKSTGDNFVFKEATLK